MFYQFGCAATALAEQVHGRSRAGWGGRGRHRSVAGL